ncbi:MAG: hypothetical protein ACYC6O_04440 [Thermoleophilia bacterium]
MTIKVWVDWLFRGLAALVAVAFIGVGAAYLIYFISDTSIPFPPYTVPDSLEFGELVVVFLHVFAASLLLAGTYFWYGWTALTLRICGYTLLFALIIISSFGIFLAPVLFLAFPSLFNRKPGISRSGSEAGSIPET